jgi:biopolymer transport protein ExbB
MKKSYLYILFAALMLIGAWCQPAGAQTVSTNSVLTEAKVDAEVLNMSVGEIFDAGGWMMFPLIALSLLTGALVIYFFLSLRSSQIGPEPLEEEIVKLVRMGAFDDASRLCEVKTCALSSIGLAGLDHHKGVSDVEPAILKDILEGAGARESEKLQGQTQYLLDIAVVSPMMGLLGTVFGMLKAFNAVALDVASAKPVVLAGGVSEALITTALGLMVGIPSMIAYAYFRRRASVLISGLEAQTAGIFNAFCSKRIR